MESEQLPETIRKVAMDFDSAIESKDIELILSFLAEDCEIELLGVKLTGKEGASKWIDWQFKHTSIGSATTSTAK